MGWSNAYKVPGLVTAQQYMQIVNETYFNTYGNLPDWKTIVPQSILDEVNNGWEGTDWFKEYENKNALQFSHAVSLTGGSENSKFSMSLNYSTNEGIMGGSNASDYQRYGGRINSEHVLLKGKDRTTSSPSVRTCRTGITKATTWPRAMATGTSCRQPTPPARS